MPCGKNNNTMEKYLFFYLKTGGGHLAPAKAVAEKMRSRQNGRVEILLADGLLGAKSIIKLIIESGYKNAVNQAVWTFELLYALNKIKPIGKLTAFLVTHFIKGGIEKEILENKPDKIVIFHFFIIQPVFEILKKHNLNIPVITVVTDPFTAHPIWFLNKDQKFIVFSEMLREKCVKMGIDNDNMKVFPFVLDTKFSHKIDGQKAQIIRRNLGYKPDSKIILIMGGGDGMPKGKKILKKIITSNIDAEIAIVCGNNKKMFRHVIKIIEKFRISNIRVYGYIDFVHSLIGISDIVITKCGASTFMEILLMGKIPVINNYIWEQEKGNMEFVCDSDMGILEKKIGRVPGVLNKLLTDNELYNSISTNIKNASIRNGVGPVSKYLLEFKQ
jgi:processive 1,2-diacylglycerol beta-glucosyltransferase/1,2-diacylglycerol 3-beta-galactosyltransferase